MSQRTDAIDACIVELRKELSDTDADHITQYGKDMNWHVTECIKRLERLRALPEAEPHAARWTANEIRQMWRSIEGNHTIDFAELEAMLDHLAAAAPAVEEPLAHFVTGMSVASSAAHPDDVRREQRRQSSAVEEPPPQEPIVPGACQGQCPHSRVAGERRMFCTLNEGHVGNHCDASLFCWPAFAPPPPTTQGKIVSSHPFDPHKTSVSFEQAGYTPPPTEAEPFTSHQVEADMRYIAQFHSDHAKRVEAMLRRYAALLAAREGQ